MHLTSDRGSRPGNRHAGWPQVVTFPGLPQIRLCPIKAYGSSDHGFATRGYTEWTTRGLASGTCANRGGMSPQAASYVGVTSQGGSQAACQAIVNALGLIGTVQSGLRFDGQGLGCKAAVD